ncbi:MAG: DUF192 domain-containing protein [Balneolia bacterium]|nr:DUF192 domain-containing protein [Balneolia bacterium]
MFRPALLLLISIAFLFSCNSDSEESPRDTPSASARTLDYTAVVHFKTSPDAMEFISSVDVAVAESQIARQEGLMNVYDLPPNNGMIFIFEQQQELSFWMANTPLSLDIIFVNEDMEIVRIHSNTPPHSQQQFRSGAPALYAVEVNAGYAARHDIQEGHFIEIVR